MKFEDDGIRKLTYLFRTMFSNPEYYEIFVISSETRKKTWQGKDSNPDRLFAKNFCPNLTTGTIYLIIKKLPRVH